MGSFDNIDHQALLEKLYTYPAMRRLVKGWLKAGVMEALELSPTSAGTPQGGLCKALHNEPYAKQVTMQRNVREPWILGHFQLNSFA